MKKDVEKIYTIPNILSILRILLIPLFVYLYISKKEEDGGVSAGIVLLISGATDMLDGYIARHFNQETSLGRVLDPIADKLTQAVVVICVALVNSQNQYLIPLVAIFLLKELFMALGSLVLYKRGERPEGALWWGKLGTIVFYVVMAVIVFFPDINDLVTTILVAIVAMFMVFALVRYAMVFLKKSKQHAHPEINEGKITKDTRR